MSQENKRIVVATCNNCGSNTTKPEGWGGTVFCKAACQEEYNEKKRTEFLVGEAGKFMEQHADTYYDCPYNQKLIKERLAPWKLEPNAANLDSVFISLCAEKQILFALTRKQIDAMDSPTFDARERIDPQLGGALAEVEAKGNAKFDAPVSYKTGGTGGWGKMAQSNLAQRQANADAREANRYRGTR